MDNNLINVYKFKITPNTEYFETSFNVYVPHEDAYKLAIKYNNEEEDIVRDLYFTDEKLEILKDALINKIKNCDNLNDIFNISCYDTDCYSNNTILDEAIFKPNTKEL